MPSGGSLRRYLGAIKDSTTVSLAKVNSEYKELDIAIVKATNHVERPSREKYIRSIFAAISATRPRADVAYCIHALARRLAKTHNWAVALKSLIVIHRALREVDPTFHEEMIKYSRSRNHMLNMAHFKDDSSPEAWDYSAWVRAYALYLEERLECFRLLNYDVEMDRPRTKELDTVELLEHLPALQLLFLRVLGCQPQGAAVNNHVIQLALSLVTTESFKIYQAINDGMVNLADKFFEMSRPDAMKALNIYRRAGKLAARTTDFYEICRSIDIRRGDRFKKIEQTFDESFLSSMEEFLKVTPQGSPNRKDQMGVFTIPAPTEILTIEYKKKTEEQESREASPPPPEPVEVKTPVAEQPDLLCLDDPEPATVDLDERNAFALAIVPGGEQPTSAPFQANGAGWELALVTAPSSNEVTSKLAGGLDKFTLDSLYDDAIRRSSQMVSYNPWEQPSITGFHQQAYDPFFNSNTIPAPLSVQMATMANQQQAFMLQQQMMAPQQHVSSINPFGNPYISTTNPYGAGVHPNGSAMPVQSYNPYTGLI